MNAVRRRSLADQAGRLTALALLVAVLALAAVAGPRLTDALLESHLRAVVTGSSATARDLIATVDATHVEGTFPSLKYSVTATWNAMPETLTQARAAMPSTLRDVTGRGRFTGIGVPTQGVLGGFAGFVVSNTPDAPPGTQHIAVEAYPDLKKDAALVSGHWPSAPGGASEPIPVAMAASAAKTLGWRLGEVKRIEGGGDRSFVLVGTVRPLATDSQYWQLEPTRSRALSHPNSDGEIQFGGVVWVDADAWPDLAPRLAGGQIIAWYPVYGSRMSVANVGELSDDLTTYLANPRLIDDGTQDAKPLRMASGLPAILQGFAGTAATSSSILLMATVSALGVGALVLLTTVGLTVRSRRGVRELMRTRGASAARLTGGTAADVAVASVPGAVVGAVAGILLAAAPQGMPVVGVREILTALVCAALPVAIAAAFVAFGEGLPPVARSLVRRNSWVGEVLLVLVAAAALVVVVGQAGGSAARASGSPDPLTVVTPLLVGLAASVVVLRGYPWLLRGAAWMLRGRGHAPSFVGVLEATRTAGVAWLVAAALTATTAGVLTLELVVGADRAQRATNTPGAPLLVPGVIPLAASAVVLCAAFAAAAFAVSSVSDTEPRRARARVLYVLGFRRESASGVSLWGSAPAAVVSVVVGAIVGVACTAPVLAAVGAHAGAAQGAIDWPLVVAVAAGILACALVIAIVAVAGDGRALAPAPALHDGSLQQPRRKS